MKKIIKVLFVCSANKQRSKTAEDYFSSKLSIRNYQFESAGTNIKICKKEGTNPLTEEIVKWADIIFVMEEKHKVLINSHTREKYNSKTKILDIPDKYKYYQKELIALLDQKLSEFFDSNIY